jgi:alpha-1,2-mannosyltransferase
VAVALVGLAVLAAYLLPGLSDPQARWPLWDVRVYWWGGQQASRGAPLYASGGPFNFTYPPFAASLFRLGAAAAEGWLAAVITAGSIVALVALCWQALGAAGVRRRPETVFAVAALALLTWPVDYTLHLGEIDLIVAALVGADLLARRDGGRWQGIATGLAAGIKLTPLIFIAYLLLTRRVRGAVTAGATFAATIALGLLAGAALVLARESPVAQPGRTGPDHGGLWWRSSPSLIGWSMAWSPEVRLPSHQIRRRP